MRILVLGGSGMLGHKVYQHLSASKQEVWCTLRDPQQASPYARLPLFDASKVIWNVDVKNWDETAAQIRRCRPDVIVNAIGTIKQRAVASDPIVTIRINALLPHLLAELVGEWKGRLVHVSTDCVFSGRTGGYGESDFSDAEDLYGRTKFLGETVNVSNAITLRTSIVGRELLYRDSLLEWFLNQKGKLVQGFTKVVYSGLTTIELARVIDLVIDHHCSLNGLYHVASEPISKASLLQMLNSAFRNDVVIEEASVPISDRSLNGARFAAATGYRAPSWPEMVQALADDPTPYGAWRTKLVASRV